MKTNWLKKIAVFIERKQDILFTYDIDKQRRYVGHFPAPQNDIERSYFQYKCQMKLHPIWFRAAVTVVSLPLLISFLLMNRKKDFYPMNSVEAVFIRNGIPENVLPQVLFKEFKKIELNPENGKYLSPEDCKYLKEVFIKYPFSWHFIFKNAIKIAQYSYVKERYMPQAIIVCSEYSFTSSLLTDYCNKYDITHIDVMHGEKLFYMRDSFFRFDRCYIWDEYYKKIFLELKAEQNQFNIKIPDSMLFKESSGEKTFDFIFYLSYEKDEEMKKIAENLKKIQRKGYKVAVRPHPRYTDLRSAEKIFSGIEVEDTQKIRIEQSVLSTNNVISLYSTVLNQALHNNVPIVIDDVTDVSKYLRLREMNFICMNKDHKLLSDIIKEETIYEKDN